MLKLLPNIVSLGIGLLLAWLLTILIWSYIDPYVFDFPSKLQWATWLVILGFIYWAIVIIFGVSNKPTEMGGAKILDVYPGYVTPRGFSLWIQPNGSDTVSVAKRNLQVKVEVLSKDRVTINADATVNYLVAEAQDVLTYLNFQDPSGSDSTLTADEAYRELIERAMRIFIGHHTHDVLIGQTTEMSGYLSDTYVPIGLSMSDLGSTGKAEYGFTVSLSKVTDIDVPEALKASMLRVIEEIYEGDEELRNLDSMLAQTAKIKAAYPDLSDDQIAELVTLLRGDLAGTLIRGLGGATPFVSTATAGGGAAP